MRSQLHSAAVLAVFLPSLSSAIALNTSDTASVRDAASTIAYGLMKYYTGNITDTPSTVGVLPSPYYWWEAGAMWGALLDYYHYTGDSSYVNVTTQALLSQVGPNNDYMVPLHVKDEGNDDQAFWGFATMSAAEKDYPQPTVGNYSWLQLTENLWNTQVRRWDSENCDGGLRWQIFSFNNGYEYKNSVSNGAFFQLSARLARFTGNQTYLDWAIKSYDWAVQIGFINGNYSVFDGAQMTNNCSNTVELVWTYNTGIYLYGSAVLYNYTNGSALWEERTAGFLSAAASNFFDPFGNVSNAMYEQACETVNTCDNDQFSFKGYLSRFMWGTTALAPFSKAAVAALLIPSAQAAADSCSGGTDGMTCGQKWYVGGYDGKYGVGQQMSALETIQGLLVSDSVPPLHSNQVHLKVSIASSAPLPTQTGSTTPTKRSSAELSTGCKASWALWLAIAGVLAPVGFIQGLGAF